MKFLLSLHGAWSELNEPQRCASESLEVWSKLLVVVDDTDWCESLILCRKALFADSSQVEPLYQLLIGRSVHQRVGIEQDTVAGGRDVDKQLLDSSAAVLSFHRAAVQRP